MIDFRSVNSITIPEGVPINIQIDGDLVWRGKSITYKNLLYELSGDGSHYSCVGVKSGYDATTVKVDGTISRTPVTEIHREAFSSLSGLTKITFERTPDSIGDDAFTGCDSLATIVMPSATSALADSPWGSGYVRPRFEIGGVIYRRHNTLSQNRYIADGLTSAFKGGVLKQVDSIGGTPVYEMNSKCYQNKTTITELICSANLKAVEANVCSGCTNLAKVTFRSTPTSIPETAFANCPNLLDIYVPWAEGAKANAPWGATNATIHYNYTG